MAETNRTCQQQCTYTDFSISPLNDVLGSLVDKDSTKSIIEGTFIPPKGTLGGARRLLKELVCPASIKALGEIDFTLTPEENTAAWRRNDERKASVATQLTNTHHKITSMDQKMNEIDTFLWSFPLEIGFSLPCGK